MNYGSRMVTILFKREGETVKKNHIIIMLMVVVCQNSYSMVLKVKDWRERNKQNHPVDEIVVREIGVVILKMHNIWYELFSSDSYYSAQKYSQALSRDESTCDDLVAYFEACKDRVVFFDFLKKRELKCKMKKVQKLRDLVCFANKIDNLKPQNNQKWDNDRLCSLIALLEVSPGIDDWSKITLSNVEIELKKM